MQKLEADTQNYFGNNIKDKIVGLEAIYISPMKMQIFPLFAALLFGGIRILMKFYSCFRVRKLLPLPVLTIVFTIQVNAFFIRKLKSNNLLMS